MPSGGTGAADPGQEQSTEITIKEAIQKLKDNGYFSIASALRTRATSQKKSKNEPITPSSKRRPNIGGQVKDHYTLSDMARLVELAGETAYRQENQLSQEEKNSKCQEAKSLFS